MHTPRPDALTSSTKVDHDPLGEHMRPMTDYEATNYYENRRTLELVLHRLEQDYRHTYAYQSLLNLPLPSVDLRADELPMYFWPHHSYACGLQYIKNLLRPKDLVIFDPQFPISIWLHCLADHRRQVDRTAQFDQVVKILDHLRPAWWRQVNPSTLRMSSVTDCILGQVFGIELPDQAWYHSGYSLGRYILSQYIKEHEGDLSILVVVDGDYGYEHMFIDLVNKRNREEDMKVAFANALAQVEAVDPNWFTKVNVTTLVLSSYDKCILAQVFGDYDEGLEKLRRHATLEGVEYVKDRRPFIHDSDFQDLWIKAIWERKETLELKTNVHNAILALNRVRPEWLDRVNLETLKMADSYDCLLFQVFGSYSRGLEALNYGPDTFAFRGHPSYDKLWTDVLTQLLAVHAAAKKLDATYYTWWTLAIDPWDTTVGLLEGMSDGIMGRGRGMDPECLLDSLSMAGWSEVRDESTLFDPELQWMWAHEVSLRFREYAVPEDVTTVTALLDQVFPDWAKSINLDIWNQNSASCCILGQLGDYVELRETLTHAYGYDFQRHVLGGAYRDTFPLYLEIRRRL